MEGKEKAKERDYVAFLDEGYEGDRLTYIGIVKLFIVRLALWRLLPSKIADYLIQRTFLRRA